MTLNGSSKLEVRLASPAEVERWDEFICHFPARRVTHTRGWLESLQASGCGTPTYLMAEHNGELVGALCGLLKRLGPLKTFGSPLPGTQSVGMGPLFVPDRVAEHAMVHSLTTYLEQQLGVHYIEWMCRSLDRRVMESLGYQGAPVATYVASLTPQDPMRAFKAMKDSARRNCKRADKLGLVARFERDESFVEEAYDQMQEVFGRRGNAISFDKRRVLQFFRYMQAADRLIAIGIYLPEQGPCIATGLFTVYERELLLWQWTHRTEHRWYRPTEYMTWQAMQRAMETGCDSFDLMGGGDFKAKFGAALNTDKVRWVRGRYRWLNTARHLAERCYRWQQSVRGGHLAAVEDHAREESLVS